MSWRQWQVYYRRVGTTIPSPLSQKLVSMQLSDFNSQVLAGNLSICGANVSIGC